MYFKLAVLISLEISRAKACSASDAKFQVASEPAECPICKTVPTYEAELALEITLLKVAQSKF